MTIHFIEHIVEPEKLLMIWQSNSENHRKRYVVAELDKADANVCLRYLINTPDFKEAQTHGFVGYPAFKLEKQIHEGVLDAFMRRLPPRRRDDFPQYLASLRIKPDAKLSEFALLGYSGAKLPSDSFSFVHPFEKVATPCELLLEVAGFRYKDLKDSAQVSLGTAVSFSKEFDQQLQEAVIKILIADVEIGYVPRALLPTLTRWIDTGVIQHAFIEKKNGSADKPMLYLYLKISPHLE